MTNNLKTKHLVQFYTLHYCKRMSEADLSTTCRAPAAAATAAAAPAPALAPATAAALAAPTATSSITTAIRTRPTTARRPPTTL